MGDIHLEGQSTHGEAATEQPPQKATSACTQTSAKHRTAKAQKYHHWTSPVPTTLQSKDLKNQSQSLAGSCAALSFRKINRWLMWLQTSCTLYHQCSLGRDKKKKKEKTLACRDTKRNCRTVKCNHKGNVNLPAASTGKMWLQCGRCGSAETLGLTLYYKWAVSYLRDVKTAPCTWI